MSDDKTVSLGLNESKSILEHVFELRKKLFIALGAVIIGTTIAHLFHEQIINFLLVPAGNQHLIFLSPLEPLFFIFKIDFIAGIIFAFPVIIWCLFSYIAPALSKRINTLLFLFYIVSSLLLVTGLLYAFLVTIPLSLKFLFSITIPGIQNQISAQNYIDFFITQALIISLIFQVPILIVGGIYLGILKTKILAAKRRYIYFIIIIALAIITPTTDVFSLMIIFVPCLAIFEISLIGGRIIEAFKKKKRIIISSSG